MAITCLDNFIGLRGACNGSTPISGRYINDLPGVDLRMLSNLSNEEQADYDGVWNEIYRRSVGELESEVSIRMQKYFKKSQILENTQSGYYKSPAVTESASAEYKGIAILYNGTKYTSVFVNEVGLYLSGSATVTIKVFDYRTGATLDTLSFSGTTGMNYFQINKEYYSYDKKAQIYICYDATAIASQETNVFSPYDESSSESFVRGARISTVGTVLEANMTFEGNTYGLTVNFNIKCSVARLICSIRDSLVSPLYFKLAEQLLLERSMSDRLNKYTMFNAERADELRAEYIAKYNQSLDNVLNELEPIADGTCIECEKERSYQYLMP